MDIKCSKCQSSFAPAEELILKRGPLYIYYNCPGCHKVVTIKNKQAEPGEELPHQNNNSMETVVPGWLIVHDETVKPQTFDLKPGKNTVGRRSSLDADIPIETEDMTMSRQHCVIDVMENPRTGEYNFCINDFKSTNGTILNGSVQRKLHEQDMIYLSDGDTFQLGMTKIVFKKNSSLKKKAAVVQEVLGQPYKPTVVITKDQLKHIYKV